MRSSRAPGSAWCQVSGTRRAPCVVPLLSLVGGLPNPDEVIGWVLGPESPQQRDRRRRGGKRNQQATPGRALSGAGRSRVGHSFGPSAASGGALAGCRSAHAVQRLGEGFAGCPGSSGTVAPPQGTANPRPKAGGRPPCGRVPAKVCREAPAYRLDDGPDRPWFWEPGARIRARLGWLLPGMRGRPRSRPLCAACGAAMSWQCVPPSHKDPTRSWLRPPVGTTALRTHLHLDSGKTVSAHSHTPRYRG